MKDEEMIRGDIPMSKMEVRSVSLSYLELYEAKSMLDVGAGTGSVAIEAGRRHPQLKVTAIERESEGIELIQMNAERLKVKVTTVHNEAPCELEGTFDRVFLGGTGRKLSSILEWLKDGRLEPGAILVANAIAIESLGETIKAFEAAGFTELEGSMIQASRLEPLGSYHYFKPLNPCYIIKAKWR